jgi:membrane protein implicated in regulation of membrane protease activity
MKIRKASYIALLVVILVFVVLRFFPVLFKLIQIFTMGLRFLALPILGLALILLIRKVISSTGQPSSSDEKLSKARDVSNSVKKNE